MCSNWIYCFYVATEGGFLQLGKLLYCWKSQSELIFCMCHMEKECAFLCVDRSCLLRYVQDFAAV